jgi:hypothetical protein
MINKKSQKHGLNEQLTRIKSIMGINENINATEATNQLNSILTVLDKKRDLAFITFGDLNPSEKNSITKLINSEPSLNSIHVKKNPLMAFVVYRDGSEKEAQELANIADKYNGLLSVNATKEDSIRIGQLLNYHPDDIDSYINKNYNTETTSLDEIAKTTNDLPKDAGLYINKDFRQTHIVLYSTSEDRIYSAISISPTREDKNTYDVVRISANDGYGPLMYDIAMSYIYPKQLTPDRTGDVADEAFEVWKYYFDKRTDINKTPITLDDKLYSTMYTHNTELDRPEIEYLIRKNSDMAYTLKVYNTRYSGKPVDIEPLILNAKNNNQNFNTLRTRSHHHYSQLKGSHDYDH